MLFRFAVQSLTKKCQTTAAAASRAVVVGSSSSTRLMSSFDLPLTYAPDANVGARQLKTTFDLPDPSIMNSNDSNGNKAKQLTKIVATIGPTSEQLPQMEQVVNAGMKIMRLNFSHATTEEVELRKTNLAKSQVSFFCSVLLLYNSIRAEKSLYSPSLFFC